jgi:hypothetical protein
MSVPTMEELRDALRIPELDKPVYKREDNLPRVVKITNHVRYRKGCSRGKWDRHG